MLNTCSLPPAEVLKIRTWPEATTYKPDQVSPSLKTSWPDEKLRGTTRGARKSISSAARPEKSGTFERICFCVSASAIADIVPPVTKVIGSHNGCRYIQDRAAGQSKPRGGLR